ncbi:unnamed protein product [Linum tenue]|uniref:Apple domain-containing protein n=1 Tax=Linum tenue TaxID=586396 RepID=A0AAV0KZX5_9ROSI|nr:unnamed protein product [Linum tenue]
MLCENGETSATTVHNLALNSSSVMGSTSATTAVSSAVDIGVGQSGSLFASTVITKGSAAMQGVKSSQGPLHHSHDSRHHVDFKGPYKDCVLPWGEGFVRVSTVKLSDSSGAVWIGKDDSGELSCERKCRKQCSCSAYTEIDDALKIKGCLLWYGELVDTVYFPASSQELYVRVEVEEFATFQGGFNDSLELKLRILLSSIGSAGFLVIVFAFFWLRQRQINSVKKRRTRYLFHPIDGSNHFQDFGGGEDMEGHSVYPSCHSSISMTFELLFSPANKLGRGGFGSMYKERLLNGQLVAVVYRFCLATAWI